MLYLNHVYRIIQNVKIFQNSITLLCESHNRSAENFKEVLKIPFEKEANRDYQKDKGKYYSNFIRRTSELHGHLLKIKSKLTLKQLYNYYSIILDFLQFLISISPGEYLPKLKVTTNEITLIKEIPDDTLEEIQEKLLQRHIIDINILLEDKILSSEVIIEYFIYQNSNSSNKVTAV